MIWFTPRVIKKVCESKDLDYKKIKKIWSVKKCGITWANGFIVVYKASNGYYFLPKTITKKYKLSDIKIIKSYLNSLDFPVYCEFDRNEETISRLALIMGARHSEDFKVGYYGRSS